MVRNAWSRSGTPQDYAEAARWYRLGAEKGDPVSAWALSEFYEGDRGVPVDFVEAKKWYELAAQHGYKG